MNAQALSTKKFGQKDAELLIRSLWVAFNNIGLYKAAHPLTVRAIGDLHTFLSRSLLPGASVSVFLEHGALVCEEWVILSRYCGERLLTRFKDAGIQSLTIAGGASLPDLEALVCGLSRARDLPTVDAIAGYLRECQVHGLRFNYITYQKVTADESIVRRDLSRLAELFTLDTPVDAAEDGGRDLVGSPSRVGRETSSGLAARLKLFREMIAADAVPSGGRRPTARELADVLGNLRASALEHVKAHLLEGTLDESRDEVLEELDLLTCSAVMRIVREEYRGGAITVERLAEIIEHLVPERRTLQRLLPMLKQTLLQEGMPLEDYLKLMRELLSRREHQDLLSIFAEAGGRIGVSVEEIVAGMRKNPQASVRMLVLAAELDSIAGVKKGSSENVLADYINAVCEEYLATETVKPATSEEREAAVRGLENDLLERLLQSGVAPQTVSGVRALLSGRSGGAERAASTGGPAFQADEMPAHEDGVATGGGSAGTGAQTPDLGSWAGSASPDTNGMGTGSGSAADLGGGPGGGSGSTVGAGPGISAAVADDGAGSGPPTSRSAPGPIRPALLELAAEIGSILPSSPGSAQQVQAFLVAVGDRAPTGSGSAPGDVEALARSFIEELRAAGIDSGRLDEVAGKIGQGLRRAFESTEDVGSHPDPTRTGSIIAALANVIPTGLGSVTSPDGGWLAAALSGVDADRFGAFVGLASEIGSLLGTDEQLHAIVENYLRRISGDEGPMPEPDAWLSREIEASGRDPSESRDAGARIAEKIREFLDRCRQAGLSAEGIAPGAIDNGNLTAALAHVVSADPPAIRSVGTRKKPLVFLPAGVLKSRQIAVAVRTELLRHRRYRTPFSTLCCSLQSVNGDAGGEARVSALSVHAAYLLGRVRELDIVGMVGTLSSGRFLIVLPNTDSAGARQAVARFNGANPAGRDGSDSFKPVYSIMGPPDSDTMTESEYLATARSQHRRSIKEWEHERISS